MKPWTMFLAKMATIMTLFAAGCADTQPLSESEVMVRNLNYKLESYAISIEGPQVVFEGQEVHLQIIGGQADIESVRWYMDGADLGTGGEVRFTAGITDRHVITIAVTPTIDPSTVIETQYYVSVIGYQDGLSCIQDFKVVTPLFAFEDEAVEASLYIPECMQGKVSGAKWGRQDVGAVTSILTEYTYPLLEAGEYRLVADIYSLDTRYPWFQIIRPVTIVTRPVEEPSPHQCEAQGLERLVSSETIETEVACGQGGLRQQTQVIRTVERCVMQNELGLRWVLQAPETQVTEVGECLGQYCQVLIGEETSILQDGESKLGLVIGSEVKPLTCAFGEEGYHQTFEQVADYRCVNGTLESLNIRPGDLVSEQLCPVYTWAPTEDWTTCSENCGGSQALVYECRDQYLQNASGERCIAETYPVTERLCDLNPEAAAFIDTQTFDEEAGSSGSCPVGQIGTIIKTRSVTESKHHACVDHQVQVIETVREEGAWNEQNLCRDYVAYRCSHDSLSIKQAQGRYQWMLKCQDTHPEIKRFMAEHHDFGVVDKKGRSFDTKRPLYATFMQMKSGREVVWKAPTSINAACDVPTSAYISAVCVSSCATPDQNILVKTAANQNPEFMRFDQAYHLNVPFVMTLKSRVLHAKKNLSHSKVDQWVTEMIDTEHEIVNIQLQSGGELRLTPNHPMVMSDGTLKLVGDLKTGDKLVRSSGKSDPIVKLETENYYGKVYNVFTQSAAPQHNVVIINDYMSGSAMFQNEAANMINRRIFRTKLIKGVK